MDINKLKETIREKLTSLFEEELENFMNPVEEGTYERDRSKKDNKSAMDYKGTSPGKKYTGRAFKGKSPEDREKIMKHAMDTKKEEKSVDEAYDEKHKKDIKEGKEVDEPKKTWEQKEDERRIVPAHRPLKQFTDRKQKLSNELMKQWIKKGK